jgi:hypothetical protein
MVFSNGSIKEELLKTIPLHGKTRGEDIFQSFYASLLEMNVPIYKLVSVTTDGASAITSENVGLIGLCRKDPTSPDFFSYHCVIHQQALCTKVICFQHVMSVVQKTINSVCARPPQHRLFKHSLDEIDAHYEDLILHTEVHWLSGEKVLFRFQELLTAITESSQNRGDLPPHLKDSRWLLDLAFLTHLTAKLNNLNTELQGKSKIIIKMIGTIDSLKGKLKLWKTQLMKGVLTQFSSIQSHADETFEVSVYMLFIDKLLKECERRYKDFEHMKFTLSFITNPYQERDVSEIAELISSVFKENVRELELEIINLQTELYTLLEFSAICTLSYSKTSVIKGECMFGST